MVADTTTTGANGAIYHERQVRDLCALHALNNLFQEKGFSKQELDQICYNLSPDVWINPHKSPLGLGNYDVNVIMAALQKRGCEAVWFDKRRDPSCLCLENIEGFILNVPSEYKFGFVSLPFKRRHWIAIKKIDHAFYNLDSKIDSPQMIGKDSDLLTYLKEQLDSKEKELFLVVSREVESEQRWLKESERKNSNEKNEDEKDLKKKTDESVKYIEETAFNNTNIDSLNNINKQMNENEKICNNQDLR